LTLKELNEYMTLRDLHQYCVEKAKQHPEHFVAIHSFYDLAEMEVQDGASVEHECELAISDIEELINNK
jgi:hypothetical protein